MIYLETRTKDKENNQYRLLHKINATEKVNTAPASSNTHNRWDGEGDNVPLKNNFPCGLLLILHLLFSLCVVFKETNNPQALCGYIIYFIYTKAEKVP